MNVYEKLKKLQGEVREKAKRTPVVFANPEEENFDPFRPHVSGKGSEYIPLWRRITSETDSGYNLPKDVNDCVYCPASATMPNPRYDPRLGFFERQEIEREAQALEASNLTPSQQSLRQRILNRVDDGAEIEDDAALSLSSDSPLPSPSDSSLPSPSDSSSVGTN